MAKINWRPYQIACKNAIKENYDQGVTEQLIVQATGTGKRLQAVDLSKHFKRTLFIAHREELIQQAQDEIEMLHPFETGIVKGKRFEIHKRIVVASVQTLYNRLDKINPDSFDYVVVDEAHHYVSPTFLATVRHFTPRLRTVWTATPKRLDGLSLSNIAQKIVFEYRIQDGIKEGFLAPIEAYQIKTNTDISKVKKVAGDFNMGELSVAIDTPERNERIVEKYIEYAHGMQGIAFTVDIDHAHNLMQKFVEKGITCAAVSSDEVRCPNRAELIQKFKDKEIQVLTNVNILTEGFDYPDVGIVMMGRPTQSEVLYTQCLDDQTEILTNHGWKTINTITRNDKSAAFNINTREIKYLPINEIYKRKRGPDESMYSISLPGIDIRVTGGHRMIQSKRINKNKIFTTNHFINASDFANNTDLVKIPVSGYKLEKGLPLTEWEIKFLGLFLSDGSYNKTTKQVYIAQSKHQKWNSDIVRILNNCGFEYTIREVNRVTNYSKASTMLYYYISNRYTKHLLKFIDKNLNKNYDKIEPNQLSHLIYGINLGDGNKTVKIDWERHTLTISTGNYVFAENLQRLCIFNGFRCNISTRINEITKTKSWQLHITPNKLGKSLSFGKSDKRQKFSREECFKEENVWCVSNIWETIITRRNGKVAILGNCIGRGTRLKTNSFRERFETDACIVLDFVDNTGKHSLVNAYELEKDKPIEERMFISFADKEKLLKEREKRQRKMVETYGRDSKIDLLRLPEVKAWNSEKMLEPATEKQVKWLQDIGLWQEDAEYTKAQASELISNQKAQSWQVIFLAKNGYDVSAGATVGQYQKVKWMIDQRDKFKVKN